MARKSQVACLFCGNLSCTCNQSSKLGSTKKSSNKTKPVVETRTSDNTQADDPFGNFEPEQNKFQKRVERNETPETQEDLELIAALQNLEPILSGQTKRSLQSQGLLNSMPVEIEKRLVDWRRERGQDS